MPMRRRAFLSTAPAALCLAGAGVTLSGCGLWGPPVNLLSTLERTIQAMEIFDNYLKENDIKDLGEAELAAFADFLTKAMNSEPAVFPEPLLIRLREDAAMEGYRDADRGLSAGRRIFTIEIDADGARLIAQDEFGEATSLGVSGASFLGGALHRALLARQSAAGVSADAFSGRRLTPAADYARDRASR